MSFDFFAIRPTVESDRSIEACYKSYKPVDFYMARLKNEKFDARGVELDHKLDLKNV